MRKITFIIVLLVLTICSNAHATVVSYDVSGATIEQKIMLQAMLSRELFEIGITHDGITRLPDDGTSQVYDVANPSSDPTAITRANLLEEYNEWVTEKEDAEQAAAAKQAEYDNEIKNNGLKKITLAQAEAQIDAISNLADAKVVLKKLIRYLIAMGVFDRE